MRWMALIGLFGCATTPAPGFYSQHLRDGQIVVAAHESVSIAAVQAARAKLHQVLEHAPRLRRNIESSRMELHVIGKLQFTSDLPEHASQRGVRLGNGELFDDHMRGGHISSRFSSCTEGALLGYVADRSFGIEGCIHELGHAVEWLGLSPTVRDQIRVAFERAVQDGKFKGEYAATNAHEYFAEATRLYFTPDGRYPFISPLLGRGRDWLRAQDAATFELVDALYTDRTDPGELHRVSISLHPASEAVRSGDGRLPVRIDVTNATAAPIRAIWLQQDGQRDARPVSVLIGANDTQTVYTFATHAFVLVDAAGASLGSFVAATDDGELTIR